MAENKAYIEIPVRMIREHDYMRNDGSMGTFYKIDIPDGEWAGWEVGPNYVNPSLTGREDMRSCVFYTNNPARLSKLERDEDGRGVRDAQGKYIRHEMTLPVEEVQKYFEDLATRGFQAAANEDIPF